MDFVCHASKAKQTVGPCCRLPAPGTRGRLCSVVGHHWLCCGETPKPSPRRPVVHVQRTLQVLFRVSAKLALTARSRLRAQAAPLCVRRCAGGPVVTPSSRPGPPSPVDLGRHQALQFSVSCGLASVFCCWSWKGLGAAGAEAERPCVSLGRVHWESPSPGAGVAPGSSSSSRRLPRRPEVRACGCLRVCTIRLCAQ